MLRQILRDLWVEPELLAELDDEQRLTLFCHMRAEQVRRWAERERKLPSPPPRPPPKPGSKRVDWLLGADGEPWVWVMGDHPDDLCLDHSGRQEPDGQEDAAHSGEPLQAPSTQPAQLMDAAREQMTSDCSGASQDFSQSEEAIYCSVDELRAVVKATENNPTSVERRGALQEICLNTSQLPPPALQSPADKVLARVAQWEKRVAEERGPRPPRPRIRPRPPHLQPPSATTAAAADAEASEDVAWREQESGVNSNVIERRAKEAEAQIREIARRAREEHRRSSLLPMEVEPPTTPSAITTASAPTADVNNSAPATVPAPKPPSTEAVVEWFRSSEVARNAGLAPGTNLVAPWFHGLISRAEAEQRLSAVSEGSFLVRVSERVWGYAVSLRATGRCKHFLVDASTGTYQFLGHRQLAHSSLGDLVEYHSTQPITMLGGERLLQPCPRSEVPSIFEGLLSPCSTTL